MQPLSQEANLINQPLPIPYDNMNVYKQQNTVSSNQDVRRRREKQQYNRSGNNFQYNQPRNSARRRRNQQNNQNNGNSQYNQQNGTSYNQQNRRKRRNQNYQQSNRNSYNSQGNRRRLNQQNFQNNRQRQNGELFMGQNRRRTQQYGQVNEMINHQATVETVTRSVPYANSQINNGLNGNAFNNGQSVFHHETIMQGDRNMQNIPNL